MPKKRDGKKCLNESEFYKQRHCKVGLSGSGLIEDKQTNKHAEQASLQFKRQKDQQPSFSPLFAFHESRQKWFISLRFNGISTKTHIKGASHEGVSLAGLLHDLEEVSGRLPEVKDLCDSASKVLHGFSRVSALQCLVAAHQSERGET